MSEVLRILGGRGGLAAQWPRIPAEPGESQPEAGNKTGLVDEAPCHADSAVSTVAGIVVWNSLECLELCEASIRVYHQPAGMRDSA